MLDEIPHFPFGKPGAVMLADDAVPAHFRRQCAVPLQHRFYDLLRQENCSPGRAAFATAVLAVNPLFFLMEGTFLTDVPAFTFALAALNAYARGMRSGRFGWLAVATVMALHGVAFCHD